MNCPKCNSWSVKWVGTPELGVFSCNTCSNAFTIDEPDNSKLQAILAWLDEYHMAFKDAKRWRREFEKFLTNLLNPKP